LLERIGEGAFGLVYRAQQAQVGRDVAVKVIRPDLANDPDFVRGFEREARLIARLEHRHIVPLYDYWRDRDGAYLVMRLFRAGSLRTRIDRSGPLTVPEAARIAEQVALALASALDQGIAHGDVKPENILLDDEDNAYLSDFGIARELPGSSPRHAGSGHVPAYASPERVRGGPPTHVGDVYALGMVLRESLAGRTLPREVNEVLSRACADDPGSRYADALTFAEALRAATGSVVDEPPETASIEIANPYKGLRSFEEPDTADFFGRGRMVDRLVARLAERTDGSRLLAVVGPSGSGKSSLVGAGLVPALRRGGLAGSRAPTDGSRRTSPPACTPSASWRPRCSASRSPLRRSSSRISNATSEDSSRWPSVSCRRTGRRSSSWSSTSSRSSSRSHRRSRTGRRS
jgi:serine/threonine protein kinase